jgi:hypothetical protein
MTLFQRLFGLEFPDPAIGQIWRSRHSGRCIRVSEARVHDTGTIFVTVQHDHGPGGAWGIGMQYAVGLNQWRARLREEARSLVGPTREPRQVHVPPYPLPAPAQAPHQAPLGRVTVTLTADEAAFVLNELHSAGHGHGSSKDDFEHECPSCTAADKLRAAASSQEVPRG